jgi:hypothetical protein
MQPASCSASSKLCCWSASVDASRPGRVDLDHLDVHTAHLEGLPHGRCPVDRAREPLPELGRLADRPPDALDRILQRAFESQRRPAVDRLQSAVRNACHGFSPDS